MSALSKTTQANSATVTAVDCHAHVMSVSRPLSPERHSAPIRDVTVKEYLGVLDGLVRSVHVYFGESYRDGVFDAKASA